MHTKLSKRYELEYDFQNWPIYTFFECKVIAFGSKPCGGPWSYLVYSTSIDEERLEALVESYNIYEQDYNMACDVASDCMFVTEPTELTCEDGKCVIVN